MLKSFTQFLEESPPKPIVGYTYHTGPNYHNFPGHSKEETMDSHYEMIDHYDDKVHHSHWRPLHDYTDHSFALNSHLWDMKERPPNSHKGRIKKLDEILGTYKSPKAMTVYTGLKKHPHDYIEGNESRVYHHPGYLSTSINPNVAKGFAGEHLERDEGGNFSHVTHKHMLEIHVPEGHHGVYVAQHSASKGEAEFLMQRGQKLKIHPTPHTITHIDPSVEFGGKKLPETVNHLHIWKAEIVK